MMSHVRDPTARRELLVWLAVIVLLCVAVIVLANTVIGEYNRSPNANAIPEAPAPFAIHYATPERVARTRT